MRRKFYQNVFVRKSKFLVCNFAIGFTPQFLTNKSNIIVITRKQKEKNGRRYRPGFSTLSFIQNPLAFSFFIFVIFLSIFADPVRLCSFDNCLLFIARVLTRKKRTVKIREYDSCVQGLLIVTYLSFLFKEKCYIYVEVEKKEKKVKKRKGKKK